MLLAREFDLPYGRDRRTRRIVTLGKVRHNVSSVLRHDEQTLDERADLVLERWSHGGWDDLIYGNEGVIDLPRATDELRKRTAIGLRLLAIHEIALDMIRDNVVGR
jgi:hypothetical protein